MKTCAKYREMISCKTDNCLCAEELEELNSHLASCRGCRSLFEIYKACSKAYHTEETPPDTLLSGVMGKIEKEEQIKNEKRRPYVKKAVISALSLAACAFIVILISCHRSPG